MPPHLKQDVSDLISSFLINLLVTKEIVIKYSYKFSSFLNSGEEKYAVEKSIGRLKEQKDDQVL